MSEFTEKPHHRLSHHIDGIRIVENRQRLRSRPKHFFSNNFSLEIEYASVESRLPPGVMDRS